MDRASPIVFIIGPTGSGKTDLAVDLAQAFKGEIICADSRTVYRNLDIGTAKPTQQQRAIVPHWGLDLVDVGSSYSAAKFKKYTTDKIKDIEARGNVAFVVGGSGLYIDGLLFDYQFGDPADYTLRKKLHSMATDELIEYCVKNNIELPVNHKNKRHLVRAIEQNGINVVKNKTPIEKAIIVGITTEPDVLRQKIAQRFRDMLDVGVIEEAKNAAAEYGWSAEPLSTGIYKLIKQYVNLDISLEDVVVAQTQYEMGLVKKQLTWFKRNQYIKWFNLESAHKYLSEQLAKNN